MLQQIAGHVKEAEKSEEIQALLITAVRLVITITYYIHILYIYQTFILIPEDSLPHKLHSERLLNGVFSTYVSKGLSNS